MSDTDLGFDTTNLEDVENFSAIPAGRYNVNATKVEVKPTKNGKGKALNVTWTITDGDFRGRKLFARLNVVNESEKAQAVGRAQLGNLLRAVGKLGATDMADLVGCECEASVRVRAAENGYPESNEINRYDASGGAVPSAVAVASTNGNGAKKPPPFLRK